MSLNNKYVFTFLLKLRLIVKQIKKVLKLTELIEECKRGNLENFREIVETVSPSVFSVAFRMLGDEDLAKDVVQETMITIWQKLSLIRSAESFRTWVYRITLNKCYDTLRYAKRLNEFRPDSNTWALISEHISDHTVSEIENRENALIIDFLTDKLSPVQKAVFVLSELEEIPNDEISRITGISKSSVKSNLYHARQNIRSLIEKYLR